MPDKPALFKSTGIAIATFVGGGFATAFLIRKNMRGAGRMKDGNEALVIFGSIGAAFLVVASRTPPDFLSALLGIGIPQFLLVLAILKFTRYGDLDGAAGEFELRSNWHAFAIGFAVNLLLKGLFYVTSLLGA